MWIDSRSTSMRAWCSSSSSWRRESTAAVGRDLEDELVLVGSSRPEEFGRGTQQIGSPAKCSRTWPPGMRLFNSAGVPSATIRPWSSTAIRSAS